MFFVHWGVFGRKFSCAWFPVQWSFFCGLKNERWPYVLRASWKERLYPTVDFHPILSIAASFLAGLYIGSKISLQTKGFSLKLAPSILSPSLHPRKKKIVPRRKMPNKSDGSGLPECCACLSAVMGGVIYRPACFSQSTFSPSPVKGICMSLVMEGKEHRDHSHLRRAFRGVYPQVIKEKFSHSCWNWRRLINSPLLLCPVPITWKNNQFGRKSLSHLLLSKASSEEYRFKPIS